MGQMILCLLQFKNAISCLSRRVEVAEGVAASLFNQNDLLVRVEGCNFVSLQSR